MPADDFEQLHAAERALCPDWHAPHPMPAEAEPVEAAQPAADEAAGDALEAARRACGVRPSREIAEAEADALIAGGKRRRPAAPAPASAGQRASAPAPATPAARGLDAEARFLRGLMATAGAPAAAIERADFLATRPDWQPPAPQRPVSALTRTACKYAQDLAFAVFPMSRDKRPLVKGGFLAASRDCGQLEAWFERWPDALIAAATGALSGIVVLDLDCKGGKNGLEALRAAGVALPRSWLARSPSGGCHVYFAHPGEPVPSRANIRLFGRELAGVDVRGDGGAIILPTPGAGYQWTERRPGACDLAPLPRALLDGLRWRPAAAPMPPAAATFSLRQGVAGARWQRVVEEICGAIAGAAPGGRQEALSARAWQAGKLSRARAGLMRARRFGACLKPRDRSRARTGTGRRR